MPGHIHKPGKIGEWLLSERECHRVHAWHTQALLCIGSSLDLLHTSVCGVLSRLFLGMLHPPLVQIYPPISVSEAAAPPIRMMPCKDAWWGAKPICIH